MWWISMWTFFNVLLTFWLKNSSSGIKNDNTLNKELAKELHKSVIRKFMKRK